jgi:hypothetical protein
VFGDVEQALLADRAAAAAGKGTVQAAAASYCQHWERCSCICTHNIVACGTLQCLNARQYC